MQIQKSKIKNQNFKSKFKTDTKCHPEGAKRLKDLIRFFASLRMTVIVLLCVLSLALYTHPVYAADQPCSNDPNSDLFKQFGPCPGGLTEIEGIVANVISVVVGLGFMVLLVMLVWAGIKYLTSGGEPKAIQSAHHTFTWALLGVVFMAVAWLILQLIANFTGLPVTIFNIKSLCGEATQGFPFCNLCGEATQGFPFCK